MGKVNFNKKRTDKEWGLVQELQVRMVLTKRLWADGKEGPIFAMTKETPENADRRNVHINWAYISIASEKYWWFYLDTSIALYSTLCIF